MPPKVKGVPLDPSNSSSHSMGAIVFAESFSTELRPLSLDTPRVLFPLCNVPLLDYCIEFLLQNDIRKILVFCSSHSDTVRDHLLGGRWGRSSEVKFEVYVSNRCHSFGEALREIHMVPGATTMLGHGDFLLLYGDTICNYTGIQKALAEHKARRAADPRILMSVFFQSDKDALQLAYWNVLEEKRKEREKMKLLSVETPIYASASAIFPTDASMSFMGSTTGGGGAGGGIPFGDDAETACIYSKRPMEDRATIMLDPTTGVLIGYESHSNHSTSSGGGSGMGGQQHSDGATPTTGSINGAQFETKLVIDVKHFKKVGPKGITVRSDLLDTNMAICSHDVLTIFRENCDFKTMRECVESTLADEELGNKVALHVIPGNVFCKRVKSVHHYLAVSSCVVNGWAYPMRPDINFNQAEHSYSLSHPHIYMHPLASVVDPQQTVHASSLVGAGCVIEKGAIVKGSILGPNVKVGSGARIENSILWRDTVVGVGCRIAFACIGANVQIGSYSNIEEGVVLSTGVVIGANTTIDRYARIASIPTTTTDNDCGTNDIVGHGGRGAEYNDYDKPSNTLRTVCSLTNLLESVLETEDGGIHCEELTTQTSIRMLDNREKFRLEYVDAIRTALLESHAHHDTAVGLSQLRFSYNKTATECGQAIVYSLVRHAVASFPTEAKEANKAFKEALQQMKAMLHEARFGSQDDENGYFKIISLLEGLGEFPYLASRAGYLLKNLYDAEVVGEDGIFKFENEVLAGKHTPQVQSVWSKCQDFVEALRNAEDDD